MRGVESLTRCGGWLAVVAMAAGAAQGCSRTEAAAPPPAPPRPVAEKCLDIAPVDLHRPHQGMAYVRGGRTKLGSDQFYAEEGPVRFAEVGGFWIDTHEITNAEFADFVRATGFVTQTERTHAGGAVFFIPSVVRNLSDISQWWKISPQATWRRPDGTAQAHANYPVVQITYSDALAYAHWRGHDLPTEAEWERAARGPNPRAEYAWGDEPAPKGKPLANVWQGSFPSIDTGGDGFRGRAPEGCYPANQYGLYDMIGNVWEWVKDPWPTTPGHPPARIIKGGSFLCSEDYCQRFRPSARQPGEVDLGSSHIGFRTVWRSPPA